MEEWKEVGKELRRNRAVELLSPRELQTFIWTGLGKAPKEIGEIMQISAITVSNYRINILRKMDMDNSYQVMDYCIRADMDSARFMNQWLP